MKTCKQDANRLKKVKPLYIRALYLLLILNSCAIANEGVVDNTEQILGDSLQAAPTMVEPTTAITAEPISPTLGVFKSTDIDADELHIEDFTWLDAKQIVVSEFLYRQATSFNQSFGAHSTQPPKLTLRISTRLGYDSIDDTFSPHITARAKVRLPNANQRFKLFFNSDFDDPNNSNKLNSDENNAQVREQIRQNSTLGIQWDFMDRLGVKTKFSIGLNADPEIYGKLSFVRNWDISNTNTINWFTLAQVGSNSNISTYSQANLRHAVTDKITASYKPQVVWSEQTPGYSTNQSLSAGYAFSRVNRLTAGYSMGHMCENRECKVNNRVTWLTHQTPIWRPWVVLDSSVGYRQSNGINTSSGWYSQLQLHTYFGRNFRP